MPSNCLNVVIEHLWYCGHLSITNIFLIFLRRVRRVMLSCIKRLAQGRLTDISDSVAVRTEAYLT